MGNKQKILKHLGDNQWHNAYELNDLFGWKFASRISDLKKEGYDIESRQYMSGKTEKEYRLAKDELVGIF